MIKSGKFICPKCGTNGMNVFTDWQKKDNKWVFGKKFEFLDFSKPNWEGIKWMWTSGKTEKWDDENVENCWEKTGGITEEEWNKWQSWKCEKCSYQGSNFTEFIKECI